MTQATDIDSSIARGVLKEKADDSIALSIPGTNYQLHLAVESPVDEAVNKRVSGRIYARAKRVDLTGTGGRFIDPVVGRPRRVQGMVIAADPKANTLTVFAGVPIIATLTMDQKVTDFGLQQFVSFDVERGAIFKPV